MTDKEKKEKKRKKKYLRTVFGTEVPSKEQLPKIKAALKRAHEIREFEIDLYLRRSLFFWGFIAALLIAFGAILSNDVPTMFGKIMAFFITLLGLFVSFGWCYVAQGSTSWQKNWEKHIDFLEDDITGRLYKTAIGDRDKFFSITKVTRSIIHAFIIFWGVVGVFTAVNILYPLEDKINCFIGWLLDHWVCSLSILLLLLLVAYFIVKHLVKKAWKTDFENADKSKPSITKRFLPNLWKNNKKK